MENFMRLGLKEVSYVIKTLGISDDVSSLEGDVISEGVLYHYRKSGNMLTITGENNRSVTVTVDCQTETRVENNGNSFKRKKHFVSFTYGLDNGDYLSFSKELSLLGGYAGFQYVNKDDLLENNNPAYIGNDGKTTADFTPNLSSVRLKHSPRIFVFGSENDDEWVASKNLNGELSICYFGEDEEAKKASDVRKRILEGITEHAIVPKAIEETEMAFRAQVLDYQRTQSLAKLRDI